MPSPPCIFGPPSPPAVGVPAKVIKRLEEVPVPLSHMDQALEFILDYEI